MGAVVRLQVMPRYRGDCLPGGYNAERPCSFDKCEWNSATLGTRRRPSKPGVCILDVADRGGVTLEEIAQLTGHVRERIRQIESAALRKLAKRGIDSAALQSLRQHSYEEPRHSMVRLRDA